MKGFILVMLAAAVSADKPALPPAYAGPAPAAPAPAPDSYGSPAAPQVAAAAAPDSYGSPQAPPQTDEYGSPAAPPVSVDEYGSPQSAPQSNYAAPAAAPQETAPVGNQGYYYYYYPVRQNAPGNSNSDDGGLLGGLAKFLGPILGKKVLVIALILTGLLVAAALGVNFNIGRSFDTGSLYDYADELRDLATPYMTVDNMMVLANTVQNAINSEY